MARSLPRHSPLPARRLTSLLAVLLAPLIAVALAGCDGNDYDETHPGRPAVQSFTIDFDLDDASFEGAFATATYDAPEITPRVARDGLVVAYVREQGAWTGLPYTYGVEFADDQAVDYTVTLGYAYEEGFVDLFYELSADDDLVWDRLAEEGRRRVKIVVFGESVVRQNRRVEEWTYETVQQRFNLAAEESALDLRG